MQVSFESDISEKSEIEEEQPNKPESNLKPETPVQAYQSPINSRAQNPISNLAQILHKNKKELNDLVSQGKQPSFDYPPICYSPPDETETSGQDKLVHHRKRSKEKIQIMIGKILAKNNREHSLQLIRQAV